MAKNDWWFKFEIPKWRNDEELQRCSFSARGFWLECILLMEKSESYYLEGTPKELCRLLAAMPKELHYLVKELERSGAVDVVWKCEKCEENAHENFDIFLTCQSNVKLMSRKLQKELSVKEYNRLAKQKERNKQESNESQERIERSKKKEVIKKEEKSIVSDKPKPRSTSKLTFEQKEDFKTGMEFLQEKIGAFPDGAVQGKNLRWMLQKGATLDQIKSGLEQQVLAFGGNYRASYATLAKSIFQMIDENGKIKPNRANNGTPKYQTAREKEAEHGRKSREIIARLKSGKPLLGDGNGIDSEIFGTDESSAIN